MERAELAALVCSAFPTLYNGAVVSHLMATSKQISGPIPRRIDAAAAVTTAPQPPVPVPTVQFTSTNLATEYRMSESGT